MTIGVGLEFGVFVASYGIRSDGIQRIVTERNGSAFKLFSFNLVVVFDDY